jgi:hypothetical protein
MQLITVLNKPTYFIFQVKNSRFKLSLLFFALLAFQLGAFSQKKTLHGYVKDSKTSESLVGVSIVVDQEEIIVQSNTYGFFSLNLSNRQSYQIVFSSVGYQKDTINCFLEDENKEIEVRLVPINYELEEVVVNQNLTRINQMSSHQLGIDEIKQIPIIFGEKDPIKAFQFLPGVQPASEGSSMFVVRGGGADQNLLLLDQATVYNANHLFGFISTFNADPIKNIELCKGGFPARYGGRLSSVLDVQMKEGSSEGFHGEGGIGVVSSRFTIEGPIISKKAAFLISGRRTYADLFTKLLTPKGFDANYNFYDLNAKFNVNINRKNQIFWSLYYGDDKLAIEENIDLGFAKFKYQYGMNWGNRTSTFRWNYIFNEKLFANTSIVWTKYNFNLNDDYYRKFNDIVTASNTNYLSSIEDKGIKTDFDYFINLNQRIRYGFSITQHSFNPQIINSKFANDSLSSSEPLRNFETTFYAEYESKLTSKLSANTGIRTNIYEILNKNAWFIEPRFVLTYQFQKALSTKISYAKTSQFIHQLSNTGVGFPTDLWVPASEKAPIAYAHQLAFGLNKDFPKSYSLSVETYYKWLYNIINYKDDVTFVSTTNEKKSNFYEQKITSGKGWAYGTEVLMKKNAGKFTGWIAYTLSWSIRQFEDLNYGKPFYSRQDRRHDFEIIGTYKVNKKIKLSANWIYTTGNSITAPLATYAGFAFDMVGYIYYGQMNAYRTKPIHRLDIGVQLFKKRKKIESFWDFSIYNAYNRQNPFYYSVETLQNQQQQVTKYLLRSRALFPIIPSISYNFKF